MRGSPAASNSQNHRAWGFVGSQGPYLDPSATVGGSLASESIGRGGEKVKRYPYLPSSAKTKISHSHQAQGTAWPPGDPPSLALLQLKVYKVWGEDPAILLPPCPGLKPSPALTTLNLCLFFWPWAPPRDPLKGLELLGDQFRPERALKGQDHSTHPPVSQILSILPFRAPAGIQRLHLVRVIQQAEADLGLPTLCFGPPTATLSKSWRYGCLRPSSAQGTRRFLPPTVPTRHASP